MYRVPPPFGAASALSYSAQVSTPSTQQYSATGTPQMNFAASASNQPQHQSQQSSQQSQQKPKNDAARLTLFLAECLAVGCLKGFRHFELYLRGREELLLRVYNKPQPESKPPKDCSGASRNNSSFYGAATSSSNVSLNQPLSRQPSSRDLARTFSNSSLSTKLRQRILWQSTDNLPPASPCDRELEKDPHKTAFLIAGYARYKCPFVWLRTNHSMFTRGGDSTRQDDPIKLNALTKWKSGTVSVVDIIVEIISTVHTTPPKNPLEVCHSFFDGIPLQESVVCTAGMLNILRKVYLSDAPYASTVLSDIEALTKRFLSESIELQCLGEATLN